MLVAAAERHVQAFVGLQFGLQVGGDIGGVVDRVAKAGGVEFGDAAGALGVDAAGGGPELAAVLGTRFPLPGARRIGLLLSLSLMRRRKRPCTRWFQDRRNARDAGSMVTMRWVVRVSAPGRGRVETGVGIEPEQGADALAADGIGPQSIAPSPVFRRVLPGAVDPPLPFGVVMVHGEGIVGAVMGLTGGRVDLGPLYPSLPSHCPPKLMPSPLSSRRVCSQEVLLCMRGPVPVFPAIAWIAVHAVLDGDAGEGFRVGKGGAELDDATQCGGAIQHAAGALDHLDLLEVFEGEEAPGRPSGIATENGRPSRRTATREPAPKLYPLPPRIWGSLSTMVTPGVRDRLWSALVGRPG